MVATLVQAVLLDVEHDSAWNEVHDAHVFLEEQPHFGGRDIVANELRDHVDVVGIQRQWTSRVH